MDLTALSLQQLRYLDAVASGATFGDAADDLFVSQSALSQGLARLEQLVSVPIFETDGRRRRLTDAGGELARSARRILAEADRIGADLEARASGDLGVLRLGMVDAAALYLFPGAVTSFRAGHPDVNVVITVKDSAGCLARLSTFEDDLSIVVGPAEGFDTTPVAEEPFYLFGPGWVPAPGATWVLYPTGSHTRAWIDRELRTADLTPEVVGESGNPEVLRQLAVLNGSWTVLPATIVAGAGLVRGAAIGNRQIVVARRPHAPPNPLVKSFMGRLSSG